MPVYCLNNGDFRRKSPIFPTPCINAPAIGVPLGIRYRHTGHKKLEWRGYQMVEKVLR